MCKCRTTECHTSKCLCYRLNNQCTSTCSCIACRNGNGDEIEQSETQSPTFSLLSRCTDHLMNIFRQYPFIFFTFNEIIAILSQKYSSVKSTQVYMIVETLKSLNLLDQKQERYKLIGTVRNDEITQGSISDLKSSDNLVHDILGTFCVYSIYGNRALSINEIEKYLAPVLSWENEIERYKKLVSILDILVGINVIEEDRGLFFVCGTVHKSS